MFSPVKAITAGALVFALGSVLLIAQPFGQQAGSVPGAVTDAEPAAPVEVTGTAEAGGCPGSATYHNVGFIVERRGGYCQPVWKFDDTRLNGTVKWYDDNDRYSEGSGLVINTGAISIETDEGAWRERPVVELEFPGSLEGDAFTVVMDGDGAHVGLTLVAQVDMTKDPWGIRGFIIDGGPPPPSENASTK